jgi:hypothetical protein
VTVRKTVRLIRHCMRSRREALFLNFQGPGISGEYDAVPVYEAVDVRLARPTLSPGISGEYDAVPVYEAVMYGWLALRFPRPSMFERAR